MNHESNAGAKSRLDEVENLDFDSVLSQATSRHGVWSNDEVGKDISEQLRDCLDECRHQGKFYSHRVCDEFVTPGISVKNLGIIGLPLSVREAKAIAGECRQAPFGKGDETLADESVRRTWELDASEFTCINPQWTSYLDILAKEAMEELGVQVVAHAQPYKLLLYEEGPFSKAHRDTEKVPGMFGTLVVCLPSAHEGGSVVLVHGKEEHESETATASSFSMTTLAWYSDVQHEIMPVTSGYRLVLTYNLVQDQSLPRQTAAALDASHAKLGNLLQDWTVNHPRKKFFVYPLEHQYTPSSLSLRNLKGQDAAKGRYLDALCARNGAYWLLARMTKETQGEDYYGDKDEEDMFLLGEIVSPSGKDIKLGLRIVQKEQLLADIDVLYQDRSADSEDEGEYTGNENIPTTYRYHDTVVIMIRKDYVYKLFTQDRLQPAASLLALFDLVTEDPHCTSDMRSWVVEGVLQHSLRGIRPGESYWGYQGRIGYGKTTYKDPATHRAEFAKAFETVASYCYDNGDGDVIVRHLRKALEAENWIKSQELVGLVACQVAKDTADGKEDAWSSWLSTTLPPVPTFDYANEQRSTFEIVERILPPTSVPSFRGWHQERMRLVLQGVTTYAISDAVALIELVSTVPPETYLEVILPKVLAKPHTAGIRVFLDLLGQKAASDITIRNSIERPTFAQLVPRLAQLFRLSAEELATKVYQTYMPSLEVAPIVKEFLRIVKRCMVVDLKGEARELLGAGIPQLPQPFTSPWSKHWKSVLVFTRALIELVKPYEDPRLNQIASRFATEAIQNTATYLAGSRPRKPCDWCRSNATDDCHCDPCTQVKTFLLDGNRKVGRFSYAEKIRKHIEDSFNSREDFKFDTERRGTPHTLVVTKTKHGHARELQEWKIDIAELRTQFTQMRSEFVFDLLGDDIGVLSGLDEALVANGATEGVDVRKHQPLQNMSSSTQNVPKPAPVVGTKRKAEVVDLTEDDPF